MGATTATRRRLFDHQHGQVNNLCTHPDCQAAWARRNKEWQLQRHRGITATTNDPAVLDRVQAHIHTLEAAGWSRRSIAGAAGISATAVSRLGNRAQAHIRHTTAAAILAVQPTTLPHSPSRGVTEPFVPRTGTVRRIQALLALGWPHTEQTRRCGVKTASVLHQDGRWVTRTTHDKIAALYRDLVARPGPSDITRRRATALGYPTPAAWNNIDTDPAPDPDQPADRYGRPHDDIDEVVIQRALAGDPVRATRAEREVIVARARAAGWTLRQIEARTGITKADRYLPAPEEDTAA